MAYSYPKIIEIFKYCPVPLSVTSTKRWGNSDHHDFGNAVDFAAIYGTMSRARADRMMRDAARWWYQFSGRLLEEIHTTPFDDDNGFYVKNGSRVGPGFYGWATESAHLDHVHIAMSEYEATRLLNELRARYGPPGAKANYDANGFPVKTSTPPPQPTGTFHVVRSGDTLSGIARKYGTTVAKIMALNPYRRAPYWDGIQYASHIEPGWKIRVK